MIHNIYGLRVIGEQSFFYVGVTSLPLSVRLSAHISEARLNKSVNAKKDTIINDALFSVEIVRIKELTCSSGHAVTEENRAILEYVDNGHPLVNVLDRRKLFEGKPCSKQFALRTSSSLLEFFRSEAKRKNKSVNVVINAALAQYKKRFDKKPKR